MKWTSTQLRRKFHAFFEQHDHKTLPSSSVIPIDDPTLLFVNSGMVQFKNIILENFTKNGVICDEYS